jgi:hypothetical protein
MSLIISADVRLFACLPGCGKGWGMALHEVAIKVYGAVDGSDRTARWFVSARAL